MQSTHKFNLLTGVECQITELTGKHFRILTQNEKDTDNSFKAKLARMLESLIVSVGSVVIAELPKESKDTDVMTRAKFINSLLSEDRRFILTEARQYSMDFDTNFNFVWEYEHWGKQLTQEMKLEIPGGHFPFKPAKQQVAEYADLLREVELVLPKSGEKVRFTLLDGNGEAIGAAEKTPSTNTLFRMRRAQWFNKGAGKNGVWHMLDPETIGMKDMGYFMQMIKEHEGKVDTELRFQHPKADEQGLIGENRFVIVDVLDSKAFFFPEVLAAGS